MSYSSVQNRSSIVNDGLILYLDAANPRSYPGSGNIWYDLTKYKQEITLFNSPIFNNSGTEVRSFQFNGVNQFASGSLSPGITNVPCTVSTWLYCSTIPNNLATYWLYMNDAFIFAVVSNNVYTPNGAYYFNTRTDELIAYPSTNVTGSWINLTSITRSTSNFNKAYINGVLQYSSDVNSITPTFSNILEIGRYISNYFSGNISTIQIYDRALTDQEVLQNYNALKNRFI